MKKLIMMLVVIFVCASCLQAQRLPGGQLDEWALIARNAVREGATQNIANWQDTTLYISCALATPTAHIGTKIKVQISPLDSGDETWMTYEDFLGPTGTASSTTMTGIPNAASLTITITGSNTGLFDNDETRTIFLLGSPTIANSELCTLVSHATNTSITILDALTNTPGTSTVFWDLAETYVVELPKYANRVRILYDNTYAKDGSLVYTYSTIYGVKP